MKRARLVLVGLLLLGAPGLGAADEGDGAKGDGAKGGGPAKPTLVEARKGFRTKLRADFPADRTAAPEPPAGAPFRKVKFDAPPGKLAAYVTADPKRGRSPAIIWIAGGDCSSIGDVWSDASPEDDQTAAAFRKAGMVMMFPSLRGGNDNPGKHEGYLGEVDDVLAAAKHLAAQPFVDPKRVYLGGHSTGGTLALLVAACAPPDRFRAVFSFGPVADVAGYGDDDLPFDTRAPKELELRAPVRWLRCIRTPTFVFEGTAAPGNLDSLKELKEAAPGPLLRFHPVEGATHFTILAPVNALIAQKLLKDTGAKDKLSFTDEELAAAFAAKPPEK